MMPEHPTAAAFTPITPNPFIVGNPVRDRRMFFGREAEFDLIRRRFQPPAEGGLLVFCGERRSGKTSILFQIMDGRLGPAFLPILIDMQSMASTSEAEFLGSIASEMLAALRTNPGDAAGVRPVPRAEVVSPRTRSIPGGQALRPPSFEGQAHPTSVFLRFVEDVRREHPGRTLVLLVDEYELLESKIEAGVLSQDVLLMLAALMETHSVCLVFTGSTHIEQRRRDYWRILGKSLYREISYLQRDDAVRLIVEPIRGTVSYEDGVVERILRLTAGQPFYTQAICQSMVDVLNEERTYVAGAGVIDQVVRDIVENPFPQMVFLWDGMERDERIALALLAERLQSDADFASAADLADTLRRGRYTLRLEHGRLAAALEGLFRRDFLLKEHGRATGPARFRFRMDLWRQWVQRMHSLWEVLREEGLLPARGGAGSYPGLVRLGHWLRGKPVAIGAGAASVVLVASLLALGLPGARQHRDPPAAREETGGDHPVTNPRGVRASGATPVTMPGMNPDAKPENGPSGASEPPVSPFSREGPGDSGGSGSSASPGPPGGSGELGLLAGRPGQPPPSRIPEVLVASDPSGATVTIDGVARGQTPLLVAGLEQTLRRLRFELPGYQSLDTSLALSASSGGLSVRLQPDPPGTLLVVGDDPASFYLDGKLLQENAQAASPREVEPGTHRLEVRFSDGTRLEVPFAIRPGELLEFDHTLRRFAAPGNPAFGRGRPPGVGRPRAASPEGGAAGTSSPNHQRRP